MKNLIGIVEGFFGPQWSESKRLSYADFLSEHGGNFYIYAPKQDSFLRKSWRKNWGPTYLANLRNLKNHFQTRGIKFGVGFSPFGLGTDISSTDKRYLEDKTKILNDLDLDILGLFFDDMPINDKLAQTQVEALQIIQKSFKSKVIFCPSFYTPDPILEKVFGKMPDHYLEDIADGVPNNVSIAWTGPKVISPTIDREHLLEVAILLKRKPFIWENLFANDGPRNCKFLKLRPFSGRSESAFRETEAFAFNMMNQAEISKITYLASKYVLEGEYAPDEAFEIAVKKLCTEFFADFILKYHKMFLEKGLDNISENEKKELIGELSQMKDPGAFEIKEWLEGKFIVGNECLTD